MIHHRRLCWLLCMAGALALDTPAAANAELLPEVEGNTGRRVVSFRQQWELCETIYERQASAENRRELLQCLTASANQLERGLAQRSTKPPLLSQLVAKLRAGNAGEFPSLRQDYDEARKELAAMEARARARFSLVSQGGVSYGAWQAGFALFLTQWVRAVKAAQLSPPTFNGGFATVTGASAGAVNGLAVALASCRTTAEARPSESLFYNVWVNSLGLFGRHGKHGLFPHGSDNALAIFDDRAIKLEAMTFARDEMDRAHFAPGCRSNLGFAVTHLDARERTLHVNIRNEPVLRRATLREKFVLRLEGRSNSELDIQNVVPPGHTRYFYAHLGHESDVDPATLRDAVQASGAFPVAFPPVKLKYIEHSYDGHTKTSGTFVDGGTFDNTPIGVAIDLNRWDAEVRAARAISSNPYLDDLVEPAAYYFLDPNATPWGPAVTAPAATEQSSSVLTAVGKFAGAFVTSSLDAEFMDNARANPFVLRAKDHWISARLAMPMRHLPIAGEQLAHFNAFLEHDFRVFDFYAGMADAYEFVRAEEMLLDARRQVPLALGVHRQYLSDARYACMSAYYEWKVKNGGQRRTPWQKAITKFSELPKACADFADSVRRPLTRIRLKQTEKADPLIAGRTGFVVIRKSGLESWIGEFDTQIKDPQGTYEDDLKHAVSHHNFLSMLVGMHNYRGWLENSKRESEHLMFYEALNGNSFSDVLKQPAAAASDDWFLNSPKFIFSDLRVAGYISGHPAPEDVWAVVRRLAHDGLAHLADSQDSLLEDTVISVASRPSLDALLGVKTWPTITFGVGLGSSVDAFVGWRAYHRLRWDFGAHLGRLGDRSFSLFYTSEQNEPHLSGELYSRLLVQDIFDSSVQVDPYAGYSLWAGTKPNGDDEFADGWAQGPLFGLRATLINRLSLSAEWKYRWNSTRGLSPWHRIDTFVTWQFFLPGVF